MDKLDEFITLARRTAALVAVAVLVAASVLYFFSYRKVPERNFLELLPSPKHPEYRFYTGSAGGRFVELGACIDKYDEKADEGFTIQTVPSTGSPENTLMVATTRSGTRFAGKRCIPTVVSWLLPRVRPRPKRPGHP